jgi:hypothetical protein
MRKSVRAYAWTLSGNTLQFSGSFNFTTTYNGEFMCYGGGAVHIDSGWRSFGYDPGRCMSVAPA